LLEKLQQWRNRYAQIPLILVTEALGDEQAIKCAQSGIDAYVLLEKLPSLPAIVEQSLTSPTASALNCQIPSALCNQINVEFLSDLTHELRTPLTSILGFSRNLIDEIFGQLNAKQMQYVSAIYTSGQHLLDLVNDFLDLSKIDANREELYLETVAVQDLCRASLSMVEICARQEDLDLNLEIEAGVNICVCDQRRVKQILINLLSNAIKFTEVGSVTLKVEQRNNQITFAVIDTGMGISLEDQQKLFQPFVQIQNRRRSKYRGTGLGSALSRRLAQLHSGDITVKSTPGQGSCFTLLIPYYPQ
jgi:signal transduction histidine kinase